MGELSLLKIALLKKRGCLKSPVRHVVRTERDSSPSADGEE